MGMHPGWLEIAEQRGLIEKPVVPAPPLDILEEPFQQKIIDLAKQNGWWVAHQLDSRGTTPGIPDLEFARERYFRAELKTETGTLTKDQKNVIEILRRAGVCVYVWRPSDWNSIVAILRPESTN